MQDTVFILVTWDSNSEGAEIQAARLSMADAVAVAKQMIEGSLDGPFERVSDTLWTNKEELAFEIQAWKLQ
jgi:hypothetical protein